MKASGVLVASVMAASSVAYTSFGDRQSSDPPSNEGSSAGKQAGSGSRRSGEKEKIKPRFDGLRFIETLVTAHR